MMLPTPAAAGAFVLRHWLPALLLLALAAQTVRIEGLGIWPLRIVGLQEKYEAAIDKVREARAELKRISTTKNEQAERTGENIRQSEKRRQISDKEAERIERAPTVPQCKTPPEIIGADI